MSDKAEPLRVEVTLTFDVDPEKWQGAYGATITPTDADDLRDYFDGLQVEDLVPAAPEWLASTKPGPSVTVRVNGQ